MLSSIRQHLIKRMNWIFSLFIIGLIIGFPLAGWVIEWLVQDSGFKPSGTEVIVLHPAEMIVIKVKFASYVGLLLVFGLLISDVTWSGWRHPSVQIRLEEMDVKIPKPDKTLFLSLIAMIFLIIMALIYALYALIPFLLSYLAADATASGLDTTWRLSGYIGFVFDLSFASIVGFQTPLVTFIAIRSGLIQGDVLRRYRRHIWFGACVMGAILSPPDPLSLLLVACPVILMFEFALGLERMLVYIED